MEESTEHRTGAGGRVLHVTVFGNSADEIEMAALDEARKFFGPDAQLELGEYQASANTTLSNPGKQYAAGVRVYAHSR